MSANSRVLRSNVLLRHIFAGGVEQDEFQATLLLQTQLKLHGERQSVVSSNTSSLAWLHLPKTGSSLGNAILSNTGACPGLPDDMDLNDLAGEKVHCSTCHFDWTLDEQQREGCSLLCGTSFFDRTVGDGLLEYFSFMKYPDWKDRCSGVWAGDVSWLGEHVGVADSDYDAHYKGQGVVMLREPESRLVSQYEHLLCLSDTPWSQEEWPMWRYAQGAAGCYVRSLTRRYQETERPPINCQPVELSHTSPPGADEVPLTARDVEQAKRRLETFAFVGITEQWPLSMCLWSATFGSPCRSSMFSNTRSADSREESCAEKPASTDLKGFVDELDLEVYNFALALFHQRLEQHSLSTASCSRCYTEAGVIVEDNGVDYAKDIQLDP